MTETFERRLEARLAQPANPMPDSAPQLSMFVASWLWNQVSLPGKRCGVTPDLFLFSGGLWETRAEVSLIARVNDAVHDRVPHS